MPKGSGRRDFYGKTHTIKGSKAAQERDMRNATYREMQERAQAEAEKRRGKRKKMGGSNVR